MNSIWTGFYSLVHCIVSNRDERENMCSPLIVYKCKRSFKKIERGQKKLHLIILPSAVESEADTPSDSVDIDLGTSERSD